MCTRTGTADGPGERGSKERPLASPTGAAHTAKQPRTSQATMGKYMRKCRGAVGQEVAAMEATQAVGVRTRSRAAAVAKVVVSKRRKPLPPSPLRRTTDAAASSALGAGEGGSCYLKLRSRMLFMAPPLSTPAPAHGAESGHLGAALATGLSRCSSTASSVDASSSAAQDRSMSCRSDAAEAGSDNIRQGSTSNNSQSGRDRDRREATPSSHQLPGELSDLESDLAGQNRSPSLPSSQVQAAARARMPAAVEIEEFFAAAEEAEAKRFAYKYNFDVSRGVPLDAGRFEWAPAVSSN